MVGRAAGFIIDAGAMELPPESLFCEPISVSSWPSAPAVLMPYIGLCGLLPVSFSERAEIGKPLVFARVVGWVEACMPRRMAPSECQAAPNSRLMKLLVTVFAGFGEFGVMLPGKPSLL